VPVGEVEAGTAALPGDPAPAFIARSEDTLAQGWAAGTRPAK
jgi:hypothetical protein